MSTEMQTEEPVNSANIDREFSQKSNQDCSKDADDIAQSGHTREYTAKLLSEADCIVYSDCSIPYQDTTKKPSLLKSLMSTKPLTPTGNVGFSVVNLNPLSPLTINYEYADTDEHGPSLDRSLDRAQFTQKTSVQNDMIQGINNLRLNVNTHIGRVRKFSMNELHMNGKSNKSKYRVAFYLTILTLCLLFLYLIYQNLFSDR